jgi:hypothetical protein
MGLGVGGANNMGLVPGESVHNQIDNHSHANTYALTTTHTLTRMQGRVHNRVN